MYSKHQSAVSAYVQANQINFHKEEDLKKLMVFLQQL